MRGGSRLDFKSIRLQVKELGFQVEDDFLYLGTRRGNVHIPDVDYVRGMIQTEAPKETVNTVEAFSDALFPTMVFRLTSFEYPGECVISYNGLDFANFTTDKDGNYSAIYPPVRRGGLLFIPGGLSFPTDEETVVSTMYEDDSQSTQYFITLDPSNMLTIYLEASGQEDGELGIFKVSGPARSTTGFPETVESSEIQ